MPGPQDTSWGLYPVRLSTLFRYAILTLILFGVGFTLHWLWILAAIMAVVWLISLFVGGVGGRRGAWR